MTGMMEFDEEAVRRVEMAYTTPDIVEQRAGVIAALALGSGERVLDVGVGPGFLAAEIAAVVGPGGRVCGIDLSADMLAVAARRDPGTDAAAVELELAGAEAIPYTDGSFDAVVSTQVLEYVPDIPAALAEIHRVLRPGGRVLVLDTDWDSLVWATPDEEVMARVLVAWREHLADPYLPRTLRRALTAAGFAVDRPSVVPLLNVGTPEQSFSGILLGLVATFVKGRNGLDATTVEAWEDSMRGLGDDWFFSLNRYVFTATRT
ncbi:MULTISPECIES: methyltransferase domain-containing protein [unclassified Nocardioides]|uniref:methyltransferase domain-containing protein n=1 Tax=unclassified Nocardioides TaxID=2615069 RepID=UPI00361473C0